MAELKVPILSIITPTTGKKSLFDLIESITIQGFPVNHIILWDDKREDAFAKGLSPDILDKKEYWDSYQYRVNNIILKGNYTNGQATGSSLRAIGLMVANTEFVTFADSDVIWEKDHLKTMLFTIKEKNWVYCKRKIWAEVEGKNKQEYLGVDDFESVGEEAKVPYKMVDNNCMLFRRKFGVSASPLYRETFMYNDDRLFYDFMKKYGGEPAKTLLPTVNQVCPSRLKEFFRAGCTKE